MCFFHSRYEPIEQSIFLAAIVRNRTLTLIEREDDTRS
jgi:hypothetical protein